MKNLKIPDFKIKVKNSDFCVKESFFLSEELSPKKSLYSYLIVKKENLTTFQLLDRLVQIFSISTDEISAPGLKDEQAVAVQVVSVKKIILKSELGKVNEKLSKEKIKICDVAGYGKKPIMKKMLHGNEFKITIRNLNVGVAEKLKDMINKNRYQDFVNYYDEQRFGTPGSYHNNHLIGKFLLERNWEKAFDEYMKSGDNGEEKERVRQVFDKSSLFQEALLQIEMKKRDFFISSYNSYLWNQKLSELISMSQKSTEVEFPFMGKLFLLTNKSKGIPLLLTTKSYELDWQKNKKVITSKTRPTNIVTAVFLIIDAKDRVFKEKRALTISFFLTTGCYATMFVKQLLLKTIN